MLVLCILYACIVVCWCSMFVYFYVRCTCCICAVCALYAPQSFVCHARFTVEIYCICTNLHKSNQTLFEKKIEVNIIIDAICTQTILLFITLNNHYLIILI